MITTDPSLQSVPIAHHPDPAVLLAYSAGALSEGVALAIACHASICRSCRNEIERLDAVGGAMISEAGPAALGDDALDRLLARLDEPVPQAPVAPHLDPQTRTVVPGPLQRYLSCSLSSLPWHRIGRSLEEVRLPLSGSGAKAALMRIKAGRTVPRHSHSGLEYTLVLAGGYQDDDAVFRRGDYAEFDSNHEHQPVADTDGDCLCLVILDAPLRLSGWLGRLINPFLRV